jgi:hypothetical protein
MGKKLEILKKLSEGKESTWLKEAKNREKYSQWYDIKFWIELKWIMFIKMENGVKKRSLISIGVIIGVLLFTLIPYYVGVFMTALENDKWHHPPPLYWIVGFITIIFYAVLIGMFQIWLRWLLTGKPFKNS